MSDSCLTYLSCGGMQHANVLRRHDVDQLARLDVSDFYEVRFKSKDIRVRECEGIGIAFP